MAGQTWRRRVPCSHEGPAGACGVCLSRKADAHVLDVGGCAQMRCLPAGTLVSGVLSLAFGLYGNKGACAGPAGRC